MHPQVVGNARAILRGNTGFAVLSNTGTVAKEGVGVLLRSKATSHA